MTSQYAKEAAAMIAADTAFIVDSSNAEHMEVLANIIDHFYEKQSADLVETLKGIVAIGREFYDMDCGPNGSEWIAKAEAAIARAEGRE